MLAAFLSFLYIDLQIRRDNSHTTRVLSSVWFSSLLVSAWVAGSSKARAQFDNGFILLCCIKVLHGAYATLTGMAEALSTLAIERHVFAICREWQLRLLVTHENNRRPAEQFRVQSVTAMLPV